MKFTTVWSTVIALIHVFALESKAAPTRRDLSNINVRYYPSLFPIQPDTFHIGANSDRNSRPPPNETERRLLNYLIPNAINALDFTRRNQQGELQYITNAMQQEQAQQCPGQANSPSTSAAHFLNVRENLVLRVNMDVMIGNPFSELGGPGQDHATTAFIQQQAQPSGMPQGRSLAEILENAVNMGEIMMQIYLSRGDGWGQQLTRLHFYVGVSANPCPLLNNAPLLPPPSAPLPTLDDDWCAQNGCAQMEVDRFSH